MNRFKLGVLLESFRLPWRDALKCAADLHLDGVQVRVTDGELGIDNITEATANELRKRIADHGLRISALCGDLGHGFHDPQVNPTLIEKSKRIIDLAKFLGTDIVTTHIGVVPAEKQHPRYAVMQDACGELARYADSRQAHFAVETGPETSAGLRAFLDGLHSTGVAVNLDPANLVMVTGDDPVQAVKTLAPYIVHTHAKDGRKLLERAPEIIYGLEERDMLADPAFIELPLGEGDVPFQAYLDALTAIGFDGYLTIEREVGADPKADIVKAANYLRTLLGE